MKEITMFMMPTCPHCKKALTMVEELFKKHPEYKDIPLRKVDETVETEYANSFDYHFVPTYYVGDEKLHEGVPTEEAIAKVFATAFKG